MSARLALHASRVSIMCAALLLAVGLLSVAPDLALANVAHTPPANRCDGNVCVDCAWSPQAAACVGKCNTPANAVCNNCVCKYYLDPVDNTAQCYCLK